MAFASHGVPLNEGALDLYLKEISAFPLISREEEVRLAKEIEAGNEEALETLVRSNLRFVVMVAKKYQNQGVPLADLINEGNMGLIRAARKFDRTRGVKFISYAVWWIRQAILQALAEQGRTIRVPLNRANALHKVGRKYAHLLQELGRKPTPAEIAEALDLSREEVERALALSRACISLDAPLSGNAETRLHDLDLDVGDRVETDTDEEALRAAIEEAFASLHRREAKILHLYFGLDDQEPMTLEEIGVLLGITRERVRQIKEKALDRLRHASRARYLDGFRGFAP
jgi:RNA polymerase primary sigma factor